MKRKEFLTTAGMLGVTPLVGLASDVHAVQKENNQYFEWIHYKLHPGSRQKGVADFYKNTAITAWNKIGINKVGVFSVSYGQNSPSLYVLIPHSSLESVYTSNEKLLMDKDFVEAGKTFLGPTLDDAPFVRMEKSILRAFNNLPEVNVPQTLMKNNNRIYELRIYESPSILAAKKKIHMFNEGNEIGIFKKTGLRPVFFGETISGPIMPNLHYMLAFENMAERDKAWNVFRDDPDWMKLKAETMYADTVSCITDIILKPLPFSQI